MPGVFNVGNSYNVNNKRVSSKLTFDSGEKFSGKIIKKGDKDEVTIKLLDGWEFPAEVDGDIESLDNGLQRFQVEGFANGKLKLKVIAKSVSGEELAQSEFNDIISKEGLSKEDVNLLKSMLKFGIPLSKENIKEIKGLIQFLDKIQANPKEVDEFISKYLMSKGISENSEKGIKINNTLKEFLNEFKTLSKEDILLFFENDIEFNKENIKGYNNIFKGESNIPKLLDDISNSIPQFKEAILEDNLSLNNLDNTNDNLKSNNINIETIDIQEEVDIKNPQGINNGKEVNSDQKNINGQETNKGQEVNNINNKLVNELYQKGDSGNSKVSMLSLLKSISGQAEDLINTSLKEILTNRRVEFTSNEFDRAFNSINLMKPEEFIGKLKEIIAEFNEVGVKNIVDDFNNYLNKTNNEALGVTESLDFSKGEVEKLLSTAMGKEITLTEEEFSKLKDVINLKYQETLDKDSIENTKKSDLLKDGVIKDTKINDSIVKDTSIKNAIIKSDISVNDKLNIPSKELIEAFINKDGANNKEIIKDIISTLKKESIISEKIIEVIKNNINEIKVFNKISEEYYYADVPVNIKEREYPCKIIIKDNRKEGKKIDSTNVKMVVTVDTKNLGTIDGYMKVLDRKIDIDLKCEEKFVKIVDMAKAKLVDNIENMGFLVNVKVSKKECEVSLTSCRDFFSSNSGISLDRRV